MITVYTKDGCPNCVKLKKGLDAEGIIYKEVDVVKEAKVDYLRAWGVKSLPAISGVPLYVAEGVWESANRVYYGTVQGMLNICSERC